MSMLTTKINLSENQYGMSSFTCHMLCLCEDDCIMVRSQRFQLNDHLFTLTHFHGTTQVHTIFNMHIQYSRQTSITKAHTLATPTSHSDCLSVPAQQQPVATAGSRSLLIRGRVTSPPLGSGLDASVDPQRTRASSRKTHS